MPTTAKPYFNARRRTRDDLSVAPDNLDARQLTVSVERVLWKGVEPDASLAICFDAASQERVTVALPKIGIVGETLVVMGRYRFGPRGWNFQAHEALPLPDTTLRADLALWEATQKVQLPALYAMRLLVHYGEQAIEQLDRDPYVLCRLEADFASIDPIAEQLGIASDDPRRLRAGIAHALQLATDEGHCYLERESLIADGAAELARPDQQPVERAALDTALDQLVRERLIVARRPSKGSVAPQRLSAILSRPRPQPKTAGSSAEGWILRPDSDRVEAACATLLDRHSRQPIAAAAGSTPKLPHPLSAEQSQAIECAAAHAVSVITGGPGSGKTTTIRALAERLAVRGKVVLCAPTGKAAKRMSEATDAEAITIHRLLYQRTQLDPYAAIICDEASMLDLPLVERLLEAISDTTQLVFVGDPDQLPPVGLGSFFADLIRSNHVPVARLTEVYRQAADSLVLINARRIAAGQTPYWSHSEAERGEGRALRDDFHFIDCTDPHEAAQLACQTAGAQALLLAPTRRGAAGVEALNRLQQSLLNPVRRTVLEAEAGDIRIGDPTLVTRNDRRLEIVNGDVGTLYDYNRRRGTVTLSLEQRMVTVAIPQAEEILAPGYALTVHKAQGSQAPQVVMALVAGGERLLSRNLIYTALTRAQEGATLIGDRAGRARASGRCHPPQYPAGRAT